MILIIPLVIIGYVILVGAPLCKLGLYFMRLADSRAGPEDFIWNENICLPWLIFVGPITFLFGLIALGQYTTRSAVK